MLDLPLFYAPTVERDGLLPEEEAGHAQRVLRLVEGDQIMVTNGVGRIWLARISAISKKSCLVSLEKEQTWHPYWRGTISLYLSPTKSMDRMEWLLEKSVELGIDRIILMKSAHSERKHINKDRLIKIMLSAMKQSQKAVLPTLSVDVPFKTAVEEASRGKGLIFHCRDHEVSALGERLLPHQVLEMSDNDVSLFIGPEGDFSVEEIRFAQTCGLRGASLGESRLRTETAALTALEWVHILQAVRTEQN